MTVAEYIPVAVRLDFDALAPAFSRAVTALDEAATAEADDAALDKALRELIRLRASQLNGCAYCVNMPRAPLARPVSRTNESTPQRSGATPTCSLRPNGRRWTSPSK